jgi:hypothetical protein
MTKLIYVPGEDGDPVDGVLEIDEYKHIILPGQEPRADRDDAEELISLTEAELEALVLETIEANAGIARTSPLQMSFDKLVSDCHDEGELELALMLLQVEAARSCGIHRELLDRTMAFTAAMLPRIRASQRCRACGCTNFRGCLEGCSWVEVDLCSRCAQNGSDGP